MNEAYEKVKKVILSCNKKEQIKVAKRMMILFDLKYRDHFRSLKLNDFYNHKIDEFVWF